ncbi:helix-turn-helix transcriptional regulator [Amycolatopsis sp. YIM 10]|uniref:helix-turn-helix transcriptional regulator n=1 Tax=Amycolatopsis sp. YIM 10 TaxID=2653857 RepID=UPI001290026C|nr:helix-turn-helix transcriptional regulator [Amycolatopsis sp. YIM 10]QFU92331.1 Transcriptional regulatory protein LiaR [Amycolatopsis sp. YIM 10]
MSQVVSPVLVGRDGETGSVAEAFDRVAGGGLATLLVGGEAGVGKSRLVAEFLDRAGAKATVLTGGCVELGADGLPFAPFVAALRGLAAATGPAAFDALLPDKTDLAPLLPGAVRGPGPLGDDARPRLFEGVLALLGRLAAERPVVLVIEDAHWADRSSRDLLDFLVRNQGAVPGSMVLVTHRSEELNRAHPLRPLLAELARLPWAERLELGRLGKREVVQLVRHILGREPDPELVSAVFQRSEGNPLFVEAMLDCENSGGDTAEIPASLEDLLASRIDRLPPDAAYVAGLIGLSEVTVCHALLSEVAELDERSLSAAVRAAVDANVLVIEGEGYRFRHALIGAAATANLMPGERRSLHARYAEAMREDPTLSAGAPSVTELAQHLYRAGDFPGAICAAWRAAGEAQRLLAYAEQVRMLDRVRELWPLVPDPCCELGGVDYATVLEQAVEAASRAGDNVSGERFATMALAEIDRDAQRVRAATLLDQRARLRAQLGQPGALEDHREAIRLVPEDHPARGHLLNSYAARLMEIPRADEARDAAEAALESACHNGERSAEASALITLAVLDARLGDLEEQLPRLKRAGAIAETLGEHRVRLRAIHAESSLLRAFGRLTEAEAKARNGLAAAKESGLYRAAGAQHSLDLAGAMIDGGRWDEAMTILEQALDLSPAAAFREHLLCLKGYIALQRGDPELPERLLARAHELFGEDVRFNQDPFLVARLETELRLTQGRYGEARAVLERALSHPQLTAAGRLLWPLLVLGSRLADHDPSWRGTELLARLRRIAAELPIAGPVQHAFARLFDAYTSGAREDWDAATAAWRELGQPLRLAHACLGSAAAAITTDGDREAATELLREAYGLAGQLGAKPLRDRVADLARRARIQVVPGAPEPVGNGHARLGLTPRELEILRLVTAGKSNREIADELFISAKTASVHVSNILGKLGVANRVEAAATANQLGLFD